MMWISPRQGKIKRGRERSFPPKIKKEKGKHQQQQQKVRGEYLHVGC
jgi:hypothetical protein